MMQNENILLNLVVQLEDLKRQVVRMNRKDYDMHRLDIDILQNVIRGLYEQVLELEESEKNKLEVLKENEIPVIPPVEKENELREVEAAAENKVKEEKPDIIEPEDDSEPEEKEETVEERVKNSEPEVEMPEVVEFKIEVEKEVKKKQEITENAETDPPAEEIKISETKTVRSTIDLFSTTGEPTIFDRISHDNEPSIADKMRQTSISDLRQAIGINEKFLFINELFNGDMGRYNKALDELNEMKTKEGVVTYFIELKIHNQWKDDNEAFIKFKEILDRKIE